MKLLVCISQTPDTTAKINFDDSQTKFDANGVTFIMNPYDEWYALVRALMLKESQGGTVTVAHVGEAASDATIRKALAIGADDAIRVDAIASDAQFVATQLAAVAKEGAYDMVFFGKETIDHNGALVGAMVAEILDMPFVSFANEMEMSGNTSKISREIEGGVEIVEVDTPFVLSAAKGLAEQRIPNMRGIMMAKRKPLVVKEAQSMDSTVRVHKFEKPAPKTEVKLVDPENMEELVRLLHEEAKVI